MIATRAPGRIVILILSEWFHGHCAAGGTVFAAYTFGNLLCCTMTLAQVVAFRPTTVTCHRRWGTSTSFAIGSAALTKIPYFE